jgi:hypothetical protein
VLEWEKLGRRLAAKGRTVVNDEMIRMQALSELIRDCPDIRLIWGHMTKTYGSGLKTEQILERVALDSGRWLADKPQTGATEKAFVV